MFKMSKFSTIAVIISITVIVCFSLLIVAGSKDTSGTVNATFLAAVFGFLTPTITGLLVLLKQDQTQSKLNETQTTVQENTATLHEVHEKVNGNFDTLLAKVNPDQPSKDDPKPPLKAI